MNEEVLNKPNYWSFKYFENILWYSNASLWKGFTIPNHPSKVQEPQENPSSYFLKSNGLVIADQPLLLEQLQSSLTPPFSF